jgi:hypothetical protein
MVNQENLLIPAAGKPQIIAFSFHEKRGEIIPWLLINDEWIQQAGVPAGELIAVGFEKDLLTLKRVGDECKNN